MPRSASFVRFDRGLFHGSFGFRISADYPDGPTKTIFEALDKFRSEFPWTEKILSVRGTSHSLGEIVGVAKDRGWLVIAELDGKSRPDWLDRVGYRSVVIDNSGWIGFSFNDLTYRPGPGERLIDPQIPPDLKGMLYLEAPEFDLKEIFSFMKESKRTWRLCVHEDSGFSMGLDIG